MDTATARMLAAFLLRALRCGAVDEDELAFDQDRLAALLLAGSAAAALNMLFTWLQQTAFRRLQARFCRLIDRRRQRPLWVGDIGRAR